MTNKIKKVSAGPESHASSELILVVAMSLEDKQRLERGGSYISMNGDESYRARVESFCMTNSLPYNPSFVSVACFVGAVRRESALAYGDVKAYLRLDRVVPDIQIAASNDLRDAAFARRMKEVVVPALEPATRLAELSALAMAAPRLKYAEARLFRPLTLDDVDRFDDSGSLEANLLKLGK
jgi:hypothetical protein